MDDGTDHMLVHPSALGWTDIGNRRWRKPDGNIVHYAPGQAVHVILSGTEAEERCEQLRYGIG